MVLIPTRLPDRGSGQAPAWPDLHEDPVCIPEQYVKLIGEPHCGSNVTGPSLGIGGLLAGHPGAGQVGQHRDGGRVQCESREVVGERGEYRIHRLRVKAVRSANPSGKDALRGNAIGEITNRFLGPGHHASAGLVDGGEVDVTGEQTCDVTVTRRHRDHCARGCGMHQAGPQRDDLDRGRQIKHARDCRGHEFADAVTRKRRRNDPVGHGQPRQRVFHREECRLSQRGRLKAGGAAVRVEDRRLEVDAEFLIESGGAAVEMLTEHRFGVVKPAGHADMLRALAGKQERNPVGSLADAGRAVTDRDVVVLSRGQHGTGGGAVCHDRGHPDLFSATARERERHVGQLKFGVARQFRGKRGAGISKALGGTSRQQQNLRALRCRTGG